MAKHFKQVDYPEDIEDLAYDMDVGVEWKIWDIRETDTLRSQVDRLMWKAVPEPVIGNLIVSTRRLFENYEGVLFYYSH